MELTTVPSYWSSWSLKDAGTDRYNVCKEYQIAFGLQAYPIFQVWKIIRNKYWKLYDVNKYFDDVFDGKITTGKTLGEARRIKDKYIRNIYTTYQVVLSGKEY